MCGILGAINSPSANIEKGLQLIRRRGPDASSILRFDKVIFGHNRLSIIDLAQGANQPMTSSCGRFVIVFNGEIYNFKEIRANIENEYHFKTHSDTEVIIAAYKKWGHDCIKKFRGMFAFCIWDKEKNELFGVRDRLGVKPFYYLHDKDKFFFGSRPESVKVAAESENLQTTTDRQAVRLFLEAGYIPAPRSFYNEIKKLPPGHLFRFKENKLHIETYWSLDQILPDPNLAKRNEEDLIAELDHLIEESVRLRMVSDVPIGVFLSGGIDSSLVAAMMKKASGAQIQSFSIGFSDKDFDESLHAAAVAKHLGTKHHCEIFNANDLLNLIPDFLSQYDEPFFDYSAFPVMAVSKMTRNYVKVALSGDGGDEAFGGYHYYKLMKHVDHLQKVPLFLRKGCQSILGKVPTHKAKLLADLLTVQGRPQSYAYLRSVIKNNKSVFSQDLMQSTYGLDELFFARVTKMPANLNGPEIGMRLDTQYTLPDDYLQKVDIGSMAFSLEARDPLLDHNIFEWAAKLPTEWKIKGTNKYILRKLAYKYIPQEILDRPKMGFSIPMAEWLRGPLKSWALPLINDHAGLASLGLEPTVVQKLWQQHQDKRVQAHTTLWSILVLQSFANRKGLG